MALNNEVNINKVLEQYSERVEKLKDSLEGINHGYDDEEKELCDLRYFKEEIKDFIKSWMSYRSSYDYAVEKDVKVLQSKNSELVNKNSELLAENKILTNQVDKLTKKKEEQILIIGQLQGRVEMFNQLIEAKEDASNMVSIDLINTIDKLDEAVKTVKGISNNNSVDFKTLERADRLLNMIENNVGFLRNQREVKEQSKKPDRVGVKSPAWRQDVDNEELIKDYKVGLTISELATKYNMTYQGIKYRIKKAGLLEE